jgi:hypothetical protein
VTQAARGRPGAGARASLVRAPRRRRPRGPPGIGLRAGARPGPAAAGRPAGPGQRPAAVRVQPGPPAHGTGGPAGPGPSESGCRLVELQVQQVNSGLPVNLKFNLNAGLSHGDRDRGSVTVTRAAGDAGHWMTVRVGPDSDDHANDSDEHGIRVAEPESRRIGPARDTVTRLGHSRFDRRHDGEDDATRIVD